MPARPRTAAESGPSAATDRELVARAVQKDRWAEEALYRRHVAGLTRSVHVDLGAVVALVGLGLKGTSGFR